MDLLTCVGEILGAKSADQDLEGLRLHIEANPHDWDMYHVAADAAEDANKPHMARALRFMADRQIAPFHVTGRNNSPVPGEPGLYLNDGRPDGWQFDMVYATHPHESSGNRLATNLFSHLTGGHTPPETNQELREQFGSDDRGSYVRYDSPRHAHDAFIDAHTAYEANRSYHDALGVHGVREMPYPYHPNDWHNITGASPHNPNHWGYPLHPAHGLYQDAVATHNEVRDRWFEAAEHPPYNGEGTEENPDVTYGYGPDDEEAAAHWRRHVDLPQEHANLKSSSGLWVKSVGDELHGLAQYIVANPDDHESVGIFHRDALPMAGVTPDLSQHPSRWQGFEGASRARHPLNVVYQAAAHQYAHQNLEPALQHLAENPMSWRGHREAARLADDYGNAPLAAALRYAADNHHVPMAGIHWNDGGEQGLVADSPRRGTTLIPSALFAHIDPSRVFGGISYHGNTRRAQDAYRAAHAAWMASLQENQQ